jgi:hypothetical protein
VNLAPLTSLLARLGSEVTAAFIYGSVARQRVHAASDVDCFILTSNDFPPSQRHYIRNEFVELQRTLGFTPDVDYPVELFSVAACRAALSGPTLNLILTEALVTGQVRRKFLESDDVEILRALLDRRLVLRHAPVLDALTRQARATLQRYPASGSQILLRAIGINSTGN